MARLDIFLVSLARGGDGGDEGETQIPSGDDNKKASAKTMTTEDEVVAKGLIEFFEVHAGVEAGYLVAVAVEHLRGNVAGEEA